MEDLYPEHVKLSKVSGESQAIGEFLEWLTHEKHVWLCSMKEEFHYHYVPCEQSIQDWLAEYFDIDQGTLEMEKRQMLDELRCATIKEKAG